MTTLTKEQELALEAMIDHSCLSAVVEALSNISFEKQEHLLSNWQDRVAAAQWGHDARTLHAVVGKLIN